MALLPDLGVCAGGVLQCAPVLFAVRVDRNHIKLVLEVVSRGPSSGMHTIDSLAHDCLQMQNLLRVYNTVAFTGIHLCLTIAPSP